jgi:hypothetical protein
MTGDGSDPAKARFFVIQAMRWSGLAMVIAGLLILNGKIALPIEAGYALTLVGLIDALIMPSVLAKAWKSPLP